MPVTPWPVVLLCCSEMLVQWTTRDRVAEPYVLYGTAPGAWGSGAPANSSTYGREDLCGGVANSTGFLDPGFFHTAVMTELEPDTTYYYVYGEPVKPSSHLSCCFPWAAAARRKDLPLCIWGCCAAY